MKVGEKDPKKRKENYELLTSKERREINRKRRFRALAARMKEVQEEIEATRRGEDATRL